MILPVRGGLGGPGSRMGARAIAPVLDAGPSAAKRSAVAWATHVESGACTEAKPVGTRMGPAKALGVAATPGACGAVKKKTGIGGSLSLWVAGSRW